MKVLITERIWIEVNGEDRLFQVNDTYDLVAADQEALEDGSIVMYHTALVDENEVDIPYDSSCVIEDYQVPIHKNAAEKILATMDSTVDYLTAYDELLGIKVNPYQDVATNHYWETGDEGND
jgi:hypothetical protein